MRHPERCWRGVDFCELCHWKTVWAMMALTTTGHSQKKLASGASSACSPEYQPSTSTSRAPPPKMA